MIDGVVMPSKKSIRKSKEAKSKGKARKTTHASTLISPPPINIFYKVYNKLTNFEAYCLQSRHLYMANYIMTRMARYTNQDHLLDMEKGELKKPLDLETMSILVSKMEDMMRSGVYSSNVLECSLAYTMIVSDNEEGFLEILEKLKRFLYKVVEGPSDKIGVVTQDTDTTWSKKNTTSEGIYLTACNDSKKILERWEEAYDEWYVPNGMVLEIDHPYYNDLIKCVFVTNGDRNMAIKDSETRMYLLNVHPRFWELSVRKIK